MKSKRQPNPERLAALCRKRNVIAVYKTTSRLVNHPDRFASERRWIDHFRCVPKMVVKREPHRPRKAAPETYPEHRPWK